MKRAFIYIVTLACLSLILIIFLNHESQPNNNNGFNRIFKSIHISFRSTIILPNNKFGFSGDSDSGALLKNYADQINLFRVSEKSHKIDTIMLRFPLGFNKRVKNIYKFVLGSDIFCSNPYGEIARISPTNRRTFKFLENRFDNLVALNNQTLVLRSRSIEHNLSNRKLIKLRLGDTAKKISEFFFPAKKEGFFANDGWLDYDSKNSKIIYMYFYRGELLILDTNLNLTSKVKTIDTVRNGKLSIATITSMKKDGKTLSRVKTIAGPPKFINTFITHNHDAIYVLSKLRADNESKLSFSENQPIDAYDLNNGRYLYSFYIPKFQGIKLSQFQIVGNTIACIFGNQLVYYDWHK